MYTVDYFIKKFEAIPEENWLVRDFGYPSTKACVMGHCFHLTPRSADARYALAHLFNAHSSLFTPLSGSSNLELYLEQAVNNGIDPKYPQLTPKLRILAALYDIKALQQPAYTDITASLAVLPINETSDVATQPVTL